MRLITLGFINKIYNMTLRFLNSFILCYKCKHKSEKEKVTSSSILSIEGWEKGTLNWARLAELTILFASGSRGHIFDFRFRANTRKSEISFSRGIYIYCNQVCNRCNRNSFRNVSNYSHWRNIYGLISAVHWIIS